jgi:RNA polymerase sigma-70 factor (ECF subfamily)
MKSAADTSTKHESEAALVEAAQRGDAQAIAALLALYEEPVYRFGMRFCKDPEDALDVLQETLLAAARGFPSYRGQAAIGTWLYTIARSFCIKQRRRRSVRASSLSAGGATDHEALDLADTTMLPDEAASDHELGRAIQHAIASLPPAYRDVLVLRDVECMTAPEVAAALGIGVDAVKSRLHRARVTVREQLSPVLGEVGAPTLGCPDVLTMFSQRLEGQVDAHLCEEVQRHLDACPRCARACEGLKQTLSLCAAGRGAPVPARVQASVRKAVRDLLRSGE